LGAPWPRPEAPLRTRSAPLVRLAESLRLARSGRRLRAVRGVSLRIRPSRTGFGLDESTPAAPWVVASALLQRAEPAYEGLEPELRSLAERSAADVEPEAEPLVATFRFLAALAAARLGAMRLVWRGERDG